MNTTYSELFDRAWKTIKPQWPLTMALTFVILLGAALFSRFQYISFLTNIIISPGYIACLYKLKNNQTIGFADVFWALQSFKRFLNMLFVAIMVTVLTVIGFVLLIIPGIWVSVVLSFTTFIIVKHDKDAMDVMRLSRDLIRGRWWYVAGLWGVWMIINILGVMALGVGLLISLPVSMLMLMYAMDDIEGKQTPVTPGQSTTNSGASTFAVNS